MGQQGAELLPRLPREGEPVAVAVVKDEMIELVNPEILAQEGEEEDWEGCLSLPGMWGRVKRPKWVKIRAQDRNGNWFETEGADLAARCFCHANRPADRPACRRTGSPGGTPCTAWGLPGSKWYE